VSKGYTGEYEEDMGEEEGELVVADTERPLEETAGGGFRVRLQVAAPFFPQIIGKGGQTKVNYNYKCTIFSKISVLDLG
jgi:hypothetical protein